MGTKLAKTNQCQRTHSLRERHQSRTHHRKGFPFWTPVLYSVNTVSDSALGNQYSLREDRARYPTAVEPGRSALQFLLSQSDAIQHLS